MLPQSEVEVTSPSADTGLNMYQRKALATRKRRAARNKAARELLKSIVISTRFAAQEGK